MPVKRSNIGWCDFSGGDANFVIGCTPISEGCRNCYARNIMEKRQGRDFSEVRLYPEKLGRLKRARFEENGVPFRRGPGSRPIVFPCDLSDLFHPEVPDEFILAALHVMAQRDDVDWTVLTKRVDRMAFFDLMYLSDGFPPNVWVGATVENEKRALERAGKLLKVCARVHWLSMEPLLEATSISRWLRSRPDCVHIDNDDGTCFHPGNPTPECNVGAPCPVTDTWQGLNWVVVGAESGSSRRSFSVAWAERIHRECETAGVPFFGKQDSGFHPGVPLLIDGREVKKFPA